MALVVEDKSLGRGVGHLEDLYVNVTLLAEFFDVALAEGGLALTADGHLPGVSTCMEK